MINMVFLLLIFFMLTGSAIQQKTKVELPEAESGNSTHGQHPTLSIGKGDLLEFEGQTFPLSELHNRLKKKFEGNSNKTLVIRGDRKMQFETFGMVIEIAQGSGVSKFILATKPPEGDGGSR